jgi:hypothetical protein
MHTVEARGDALWRLHRLDIEDKHRLLFVIGLSFRSIGLPLAPDIFFGPTGALAPLEQGDVLFTGLPSPEPKNEPQFRMDVAFAESEIVEGEPLIPTLLFFAEAVEQSIESFAPLF